MVVWAPQRRSGHCSTVAIPRPATGSAGGCRSLETNRPTTSATEEHRARVLAWAQELASEGDTAIGYPVAYGGEDAPGKGVTAFEALAMGDLSLLVKCGVQFGLFGGAILHLGTERHHERYLRDVGTLELPGCFAMTETGHGSNVHALRTTATYEDGEFVIHTPDDDARKDYIGNAARDGRMAVVFAQLIAGGEERGVHALLGPDPRRARRRAARRAPRGLRRQARPQRRRQRADLVRPRARPAREPARPLRAGVRGRHVLQPDREPDQALLHDARDADPGPRERVRRGHQRVQGRAHDRRAARARAAPVRPARRARGAADGLPHAPAAAAPGDRQDLRAGVRPAAARRPSSRRRSPATTSPRGASSRRSPRR